MAKQVEGVTPTRMMLLETKKRIRLAEKGHKLLSEKRDSLVAQFFSLLDDWKRARARAEAATRTAYEELIRAEMSMGSRTVEEIALSSVSEENVDAGVFNIMGVHVPRVDFLNVEGEVFPYDLFDTTPALDAARERFNTALKYTVKLAEIEGSLERLAVEIEKTKRRVNALEHIFIPQLKKMEKYIEAQLEEREREDFFRRKRMKGLMEKRAAEGGSGGGQS